MKREENSCSMIENFLGIKLGIFQRLWLSLHELKYKLDPYLKRKNLIETLYNRMWLAMRRDTQ